MARKQKHEEHENHERWLVSYADFITLLFAFFVVMYSISSVNEGKYRVLSDAIVAAFRSQEKSIRPIQVGEPTRAPKSTQMEVQKTPGIVKSPNPPIKLLDQAIENFRSVLEDRYPELDERGFDFSKDYIVRNELGKNIEQCRFT